MMNLFALLLGAIWRVFRARRDLLLENLALRQQLAALKRRHPRPRLTVFDKAFWILTHVFWSAGWKQVLIVVTPETVVRWHRAGFRWYWSVISKVQKPVGRRGTSKQVRDLICQMTAENPAWGAPRIHGEVLMLGFDISERTVSRWMKRMSPRMRPLRAAGRVPEDDALDAEHSSCSTTSLQTGRIPDRARRTASQLREGSYGRDLGTRPAD